MATTSTETRRRPVILIADDQEWSSRSLESVLSDHGYRVILANTAGKAWDAASAQPPDLLFINHKLPNADGINLCRRVRNESQFGVALPILMTAPERPTRTQRLAALRAGAWEVLSYPLDAEELLLRLQSYLEPRFELDQIREQGLVDVLTGLYNLRGLERRVEEIASIATREKQPMACVVLAPTTDFESEDQPLSGTEAAISVVAARCGKAMRRAGRISDAIGRLGSLEFAVVAPSTDENGAIRLAERLAEAIRSSAAGKDAADFDVRAGFEAVSDLREASGLPADMLVHAAQALQQSKRLVNGDWIQPFRR